MPIALIIHGGAKTIAPEEAAAHQSGCRAALLAGWAVLQGGGSALDAVETAIRALEDDPTFNAGIGSTLNERGQVEMDSGLWVSAPERWGAVGAISAVRHPVTVARALLEHKPQLLVGAGALEFATEHTAERCAPELLITPKQLAEWEQEHAQLIGRDTVGCVALDWHGVLAAGTSTGGLGGSPVGRVGDSPLLGCGLYGEHTVGACATSGDGESIIPVGLSRTAVEFLRSHYHPDAAAEQAIDVFKRRVPGEAGLILLDNEGRVGWAHNSSHMACGYMTLGQAEPTIMLRKSLERAR